MPLNAGQLDISRSDRRFRVAICGRRFGKTHVAIRELCHAASQPNRECWAVFPSYRMAKQITWRKLKNRLQDLRWTQKVNESELTIELKNGSRICLKGADNHDSLRGVGLDFLVMDEFADIDPAAFYETLRPTLSDRQGRALFIGTPKGKNSWSFDLFQMSQEDPDNWQSFQYTTLDGGNVTEQEIAQARKDLDVRTFRQEYEATFETAGNQVYYAFDRDHNVRPYAGTTPRTVYIGCDFNVSPMSAVVFARSGDVVHAIDEISMHSSNTQELVEEIQSRYPASEIWAYPDPAGRQRKTSAGGKTDITILQNAGFTVKAPHGHNPVRDGINAVNAKLCNSLGQRTFFVDPACRRVIECLEKYGYKPDTQVPDKDSGFDHMADAIRYYFDYVFPIRRETPAVAPRRWGHAIGVK